MDGQKEYGWQNKERDAYEVNRDQYGRELDHERNVLSGQRNATLHRFNRVVFTFYDFTEGK